MELGNAITNLKGLIKMQNRYLFRGKRLDSRKLVQGYLVNKGFVSGSYSDYGTYIIYHSSGYEWDVDPQTIEPVAVKVLTLRSNENHTMFDGRCPNCLKRIGYYSTHLLPNYCSDCGQRLDWSVE